MKGFFIAVLWISLASHVWSAPAPQNQVWFAPVDATPQSAITLNAFIYNPTDTAVIVTVGFTNGGKSLGVATVTIPQDMGKVASVPWIMPTGTALVAVTVEKATTSKKSEIKSLLGPVGIITVGAAPPNVLTGKIKVWFLKTFAIIEKFRVAQATQYKALLLQSKIKAGQSGVDDIGKVLVPDAPGVPGEVTNPKDKYPDFAAYGKLIYAMALSSFFEKKLLFYISVGLLALVVVRFIVRRFV